MPYNLSPNTVEVNKEFLNKLLTGQIVKFTTVRPDKLAYNLREAIAAAKRHGIKPFAGIDYRFLVKPGGVLQAEPRKKLAVGVQQATAEVVPATTEDTFTQEVSHFDVIQLANASEAPRIVFLNFTGAIEPVETWAEKRDFEIASLDPLTLQKTNP